MINKDSPTPYYIQAKYEILRWIECGDLEADQRLPSMKELTQRLGVSANPIRRALDELIRDGVIRGVQGKGTFVARGVGDNNPLDSFSHQIQNLQLSFNTRVRSKRIIHAVGALAKELMLPENQEIFVLERLRYVDDEPFVLQTAHIRYDLCPGILDHDLSGSLYHILQDAYGLVPAKVKNRYEARLADHDELQIFKAEHPYPVLAMRQTSLLQSGLAFEYTRSVYRGNQRFFSTHTPLFMAEATDPI